MQVGINTVYRGRIEEIDKDILKQLLEKSTQFIMFSIVLSDSTDLLETPQSLIISCFIFDGQKAETHIFYKI